VAFHVFSRRLLGVGLLFALGLQVPLVSIGFATGGPSRAAAATPEYTRVEEATRQELGWAVDRAVLATGVPGLSVAFVTDDYRAWRGTSGTHRDGLPLDAGDPLRIGSVTKTFTAAMVLSLVEDGLVDLDAPAAWYLGPIPVLGNATVRQLLDHTSGIGDLYAPVTPILQGDPYRPLAPAEVLGLVGWNRPPGMAFEYSNTNYYLLGLLVEAVTGNSFNKELEERFASRFGLTGTRLVQAGEAELPAAWSTAFFTSGAMVSTPRDLARWGRAVYGGEALSEEMTWATREFGPGQEYSLGAQRLTLGGRTIPGHTGLLYDTTSLLVYLPDEGVSIAIVGTSPQTDLPAALITGFGGPSILDTILWAAHQPAPKPAPKPRRDQDSEAAAEKESASAKSEAKESEEAPSRQAKTTKGKANAWIAAAAAYEAPYPKASAVRPRTGWITTPPVEPISESKLSTVAR
jgi:D-alanyl-D-alanine carboxypeptidase